MNRRKLHYPALLLACFCWGYFVVPSHAGGTAAAPRKLAPPVSCTSANRMDIFIDEDNIMWECDCQMLMTGNICRWQVIGGVDAVEMRRAIRVRLRVRFVPRMRVLVLA